MNYWLSFIISLPTENAILRQRAWRTLKGSGAAVLRDGVYLMPEHESCRATLDRLQANVREGGGTALVLRMEEPDDANFIALFDRKIDYAVLLSEVAQTRELLRPESVQEVIKQARKFRKAFAAIAEIDFFPDEAQRQTEAALNDLEIATARLLSPDEPQNVIGQIQHCSIAHYQGRVWATRQRPWVDRLASAWLSAASSTHPPGFFGSRALPIARPMHWALILTARRSAMLPAALRSRYCWRALHWNKMRSRAWD